MFIPELDNRSDPQEPSRNPGIWQCTICEHGNDAKKISCEQCGVLRYFSLYFNNALEVDGRAKRRDKHYAVSVLARTLFSPSSAKSKDVVLSGGFKASRNATGSTRATLDALHKTYMTRKECHINIVPFKFDTPSPDDVVATGLKSSRSFRKVDTDAPHVTEKRVMDNDSSTPEKDTTADSNLPVKSNEFGESSESVSVGSQNETLCLDHELQHLSLERKSQKSKANIKKPVSSSLYKPEPWMLQHEDEGIPRQLNLAIKHARLAMSILGNQLYVVVCYMPWGGFQKSKCINMRRKLKKRGKDHLHMLGQWMRVLMKGSVALQ